MSFLSPASVNGQALRFQPQGAVATGQGNAFAAQADDASAIHYNPAGLSQVEGIQAVFGATFMGGSINARTGSGIETRGDFDGTIVFPPPSHTYLSANIGALGAPSLSSWTVGLGLNSPFGLKTRYPIDGPFNTVITSAALPLLAIKPTIAYKVNDTLSVGVGVDIYTFVPFLGEGQAEQKRLGVELNGTGTGVGGTVSLLFTPLRNSDAKPIISIGLVYRTQVAVPLRGSLLVNGRKISDGSTELGLPRIFTGAIAVWPIRTNAQEWKVEVDVEYVGWNSNENLDVQLSNGSLIPQPQQWKDVPVVAVGTEYKWINPDWLPHWDIAVRAGYTRTEDPVPNFTFNPGIISLSSQTLSVGAGFLCKGSGRLLGLITCSGESALWPKAIGIDVAYQEWFYESRTIAGNLNPVVDGTYDANVHLGTITLRSIF